MQIVENIFKKHTKAWVIVFSVIGALLLLCLLACFILNIVVNSEKIYEGVTIGNYAVGNMTREEALNLLNENYEQALTESYTLSVGEETCELSLADLNASIDAEKTVEVAYRHGRDGNLFQKVSTLFNTKKNGHTLPPAILCDDEQLKGILETMAEAVLKPGQETLIELSENAMTITKGFPGYLLNVDEAAKEFKNNILTVANNKITINPEEVTPRIPVAEELYKEYCGDPVDASYTIENHRIVYTEHKNGLLFDVKEAQSLIDNAQGDVITIPIVTTPAEMTIEKLEASLFPDKLSTYSSKYNAKDTARSHNVSLAAQKISEVVLKPGDVFSYNDIVGPRTTAQGFRVANVYVGNRIEPGVGGGICQVSSTLFNAVVLADLKIEQRTNHSLPVSYVPLGRDATVSYGSIDFKFSNNTKNMVKIVASASGGTNVVSVYGTKDNKGRTIEITTECIGTSAPKLVQTNDPSLPAGTVKVDQVGANGSTYNAYKVIKENGSVVKTEFLAKSVYLPSDHIERVGGLAAEESVESNVETYEDYPSSYVNTPTPVPPVENKTPQPAEEPVPEVTAPEAEEPVVETPPTQEEPIAETPAEAPAEAPAPKNHTDMFSNPAA